MAAIVSESVFDVHTRLMLMHANATAGLYEHRTVTESAGEKNKNKNLASLGSRNRVGIAPGFSVRRSDSN